MYFRRKKFSGYVIVDGHKGLASFKAWVFSKAQIRAKMKELEEFNVCGADITIVNMSSMSGNFFCVGNIMQWADKLWSMLEEVFNR